MASDVQQELIVEEAVRAATLSVLAESAAQPGFVRAATRFVTELGRSMVEPARFTRALRDWSGHGPRRAYAEEVAALYRSYRAGLDRAGVADADVFAWRALDALRADPEAWGGTPLFVYGFDDFTALELDALETIAGRCGADVSVSLPFEPGREAFRATARIRQELLARGAEELALEPVDVHYSERSRGALHHLERRLFEEPGDPVDPGTAISFHSAGGERAEVELAGARILELLREGVVPGDVAVVFRRPSAYASLIEQVFGAYGIPYSIDRRVPFGHTGIGRGLLALIRCASLGGSADDLLAYLRSPGRLRVTGLADRLEAAVRKEGAHSAAEARALWEEQNFELGELDRLARARDTAAFVAELDARLQSLFAAPHERRAALLRGPELDEARALREGQAALAALRDVLRPGRGRRPGGSTPRASTGCWSSSRSTWVRTRSPTASRLRPRRRSAHAASRRSSYAACRRASSRAARLPSPSWRTRTGGRSQARPGSCCPFARMHSTASATSSTSARRAPSGCS